MAEEGDTVQIKIPEWLATAKEIPTDFRCHIEEEREKAWRINIDEKKGAVWIPKSQVLSMEVTTKNETKRQKEQQDVPPDEPKKTAKDTTARPTEEAKEIERSTRLKLERELHYIDGLIEHAPEKAYNILTQFHNQLQEYLAKVREVLQELGNKLGEKPLSPAKEVNAHQLQEKRNNRKDA